MTENSNENICGYEKDNGEPCQRTAGWGTDHVGSGRCRTHPGRGAPKGNNNAVGNDGGAPENNGNAEKHGLTADAEKWFERHRDDVEDDVKQMVADWMELAPFGWEVSGNVRLLVNAAINECQIEQGDRYIEREGVITQEKIPVGDGGMMPKDVDNPVFGYKTQLQNSTLRILNKLGILDSPEAQQADAQRDLADIWRDDLNA